MASDPMTHARRAVIERVLAAFLRLYLECEDQYLDTFDVQDMLLKNGMLVETTATQQDVDDWIDDVEIELGDRIYRYSAIMQEFVNDQY